VDVVGQLASSARSYSFDNNYPIARVKHYQTKIFDVELACRLPAVPIYGRDRRQPYY
jgi:hypothetical protein